jgi:hypothetical protein
LRVFTAALLNSNLSSSELRELADGIGSGEFSREFSDLLYNISLQLSEGMLKKRLYRDFGMEKKSLEKSAYNIIQNRRLPKRELFKLVEIISPRILRKLSVNGTAKEILATFFNQPRQTKNGDC